MQTDYDMLVERVPDPRLVFLNYGYAEVRDVYPWVQEDDKPNRYHLSLVRRVLGDARVSGKRVLEVGCGRGGNCDYLMRYGGAAEVVGIDRSVGHARFCRRTHAHDRLRFAAASAESLPIRDASVDVVLNLESAHCYDDFDAFLSEAARVLAPGGTFCFADLWGLRVCPIDWDARARALSAVPMALQSEEEIGRGVAAAIERSAGLAAHFEGDEPAKQSVRGGAEQIRALLASGECAYRVLRWRR